MERIDRRDDQKLYQPRIHSERIRELYRLKLATGLPMTVILDAAIREYVAKMDDYSQVSSIPMTISIRSAQITRADSSQLD